MDDYKIPLRNKNKEIIDYTFVSKEDYEILNKFKFSKNNGYCVGYINGKSGQLIHRYFFKYFSSPGIKTKKYLTSFGVKFSKSYNLF